MKNTQKDRFEKKLISFFREWDKKKPITMLEWQEFSATLYKKYGFSDEELYKARRLVKSWTADENRLKKTKRIQRKKTLRDMYHDLDRSDMNDNPIEKEYMVNNSEILGKKCVKEAYKAIIDFIQNEKEYIRLFDIEGQLDVDNSMLLIKLDYVRDLKDE